MRPLKALARVHTGITLGKSYEGARVHEYPYLRVANVQAGRLDLKQVKTIAVPESEASRSLLRNGDVLMTEGGDPDKLGRGCLWRDEVNPCLHQNHIFAVRPVGSLIPEYLEALTGSQYSRDFFLRRAKQTTNLASTNSTTIGQLMVPLPSTDEQLLILESLRAGLVETNSAIQNAVSEIGLLREYRTRLIADIVTGKVDVRGVELPDLGHDEPVVDAELGDLETDELSDEVMEEDEALAF